MVEPIVMLKGYDFQCIRCGCCCYQREGVYMTTEEKELLGDHPSIAPLEKPVSGLYTYRILPSEGDRCPFLADNHCTIYEKRPELCRRFPLTMRYIPDIGYLYSAIICCGASHQNPSPYTVKEYSTQLNEKFRSSFEKMETLNCQKASALSKSVKVNPHIQDMETVITIWDYLGDLAYTDVIQKENLQWMSWIIMKAWYQYYLDLLQHEKYMGEKKFTDDMPRVDKLLHSYMKIQLNYLEETKETAVYASSESGENSRTTLYLCRKNPEPLEMSLSDKERSYAKFTPDALSLSRDYYSFLAKRTIRAYPFSSSVIPISFVPEILHRAVTEITGAAVLLSNYRGHKVITAEDLFDVIKLKDNHSNIGFYKKQVLESYGLSVLDI
jgi:Fe-S-cluster containining protein